MRDIVIETRYLHLPVKTGAGKRRMRFVVDGRTVREFEIEFAGVDSDAELDFLVFADVSAFAREALTVEADGLPEGSKALEVIAQSDDVPDAAGLYREKHRQQFHFSSRRGWNNDPNGLVYCDGEYHLYYQHNPFGWAWGNMHWGHAVSADLVHWREEPIAIYPHEFGDWAFSGGACVDEGDTAGFRTGDREVIVASYTSTGRGECIAYSNDRGRTFVDYEGNPVVEHRGRDPKVIWYAPGGHWVMAVYDEQGESRAVAFYSSPDLKSWEFRSRIEGYYECPELFELPVDGAEGETRWVLYSGDGNYAIGSFDGGTFTPESPKLRFSRGNAFYASQTFSNIPAPDGRRIQLAWGRSDTPGMPFNQCMLFPVVLTLRTTDDGLAMFAEPVREIESIRKRSHDLGAREFPEGESSLDVKAELPDVEVEFEAAGAGGFGIDVRGTRVGYDAGANELSCGDCKAPLKPEGRAISLRVLVDRTTVEIYANGGRVYMPVAAIAPEGNRGVAVFAKGGPASVRALKFHELRSAWPDPAAR
ncbi:MAG: glycoside hydrolase family 32 protein [Planctomycetota bacterium]|jgi:fructan beta-fructosidase